MVLESKNIQGGSICFPDACAIGLSDKSMKAKGAVLLLGSTPRSWGLLLNGKTHHNKVRSNFAPPLSNRSTDVKCVRYLVRVSVDCDSGEVSFSYDGRDFGVAFELSKEEMRTPIYPAVCFASSGHTAMFV